MIITGGVSLAVLAVGASIGGFPTISPTANGTDTADDAVDLADITGRFDGDPVETIKGVVQVTAVVDDGVLTDVVPISLTNDGPQSDLINERAIPSLKEAVLASQSANVDAVSGATYSSAGYLGSLQSALDKATTSSRLAQNGRESPAFRDQSGRVGVGSAGEGGAADG